MAAQTPLRYAICTEPRSGSTLLCQLLASTGALGRPDEFFRNGDHCADFEAAPSTLEELAARFSTPNGVFGIKVFGAQFDHTERSEWIRRLRITQFIFLEREDLLGQAISYVRALQTEQFFAHQEASGQPVYDAQEIYRHLIQLAESYARWRIFFARNGITPFGVTYERLIEDPTLLVLEIGRLLGVDLPISENLVQSHLKAQRDTISAEWRVRFLEDLQDRTKLDHPLGRARVHLRRMRLHASVALRRAMGTGKRVQTSWELLDRNSSGPER